MVQQRQYNTIQHNRFKAIQMQYNKNKEKDINLLTLNERDFLIRMLYKDCYWLAGILTFFIYTKLVARFIELCLGTVGILWCIRTLFYCFECVPWCCMMSGLRSVNFLLSEYNDDCLVFVILFDRRREKGRKVKNLFANCSMFDHFLFELVSSVKRGLFELLHVMHLLLDGRQRVESRQRHSDYNYLYLLFSTTATTWWCSG